MGLQVTGDESASPASISSWHGNSSKKSDQAWMVRRPGTVPCSHGV